MVQGSGEENIMYRQKKFKYYRKQSKYKNAFTDYNGNKYDSKFEAQVAMELDLRLKAGELSTVERQVRIHLDVNEHHICDYIIDFVVVHGENSTELAGTKEYIEVKGLEMPLWKLKWKLFEALYKDVPNILLTVIKR